MADKQRGSTTDTTKGRRPSLPPDVVNAVDRLVAASRAPAAPVPKKARRKIKKLGKQLDAARATEAKRLRQSAKARQDAERRDRQAADAAAQMASIVSTIRETAGGALRKPGAATKPAPTKAAATKAAAARKPAPTSKTVSKPAGASKAATTAKASTRRRASATQPAKPARRTGTSTSRAAKPKPTA